jgi:subtilisin-like proprotein convertase family protein
MIVKHAVVVIRSDFDFLEAFNQGSYAGKFALIVISIIQLCVIMSRHFSFSMKPALLLFSVLTCFTSSLVAQDESIVISEGESAKEYELAKDEVVITDQQGLDKVQKFSAKRHADEVRRHAEQIEATTGEEASLVLYEKGGERKLSKRRLLTTGVLVNVSPGIDADALAQAVGATLVQKPSFAKDCVVLDAGKPGASLELAKKLRGLPGVKSAEPMLARQQTKRWIPTDPFFSLQWHLRNTAQKGGTAGMDVNVISVWDTYRGTGIRIGIVDDGLETFHPDLSPNVDIINDYDWNDGDYDPDPDLLYDFHGTSCAGVAAARGGNTVGGSGAAPLARLLGMRLIAASTTDQQEADAMNYRSDLIPIKSNSWGPDDDGRTLEGPGPLTQAAFKNACSTGRGGLGTIFTWAAGNGGTVQDDSNKDGYANSIYTIAVAAMSDTGGKSDYSEPGANVVITAPSSSAKRQGITTTDLTGNKGYNTRGKSPEPTDLNYTNTFGGTSSATPLAAGVIALLLESKPTLGWRDVQEVLMRSATKNSPTDLDWVNNAAGIHFNHKFGAGLINAAAAVNLAKTWTNLGQQVNTKSTQSGLSVTIPDSNATGITRTFNIADTIRAEHVTLKLDVTHANRGDLDITLRSPSGTISKLTNLHGDTGDHYANWTFMTVRNWGEAGQGTWTLTIKDLRKKNVGTLKSATLTVFGTGNVAPPPPVTLTTVNSTDVPKNIPDGSTAGITSVLNSSVAGKVSTVTFSTNITHTYKGDLVVTLISPTGSSVILHNETGGSADNVILTGLELSDFEGQNAAGQWKLKVQDLSSQDIGKINSWSLTFATTP